ncbi:hypothetical protein D6833_00340 [Candidatus Parcubacteria bacterium]|nr:MAG: hypothetical protein D6833_00340 [Candidatus Parcubacteria bacterium]
MSKFMDSLAGLVLVMVIVVVVFVVLTHIFVLGSGAGVTPTPAVDRFVDDEAGVVCWYVRDGVSCLPIGSTNLGLEAGGE